MPKPKRNSRGHPVTKGAVKHGKAFVKALGQSGYTMSGLAATLGLSRQAVFLWQTKGVPAERVRKVAGTLGTTVERLRPDIYADLDARR